MQTYTQSRQEKKQIELDAKREFDKSYMDTLKVIKDRQLGIMHFYNKSRPQGGVTVIFDNSQKNSNVIEIVTAVCSPRDNYDRKVGVSIAMSHYVVGKSILVPHIKGQTKRDVLEIMFGIYSEL